MNNLYLVHYGIKGQKHGQRRFQNKDGSLTPAGKKRYGVGDVRYEQGLIPKTNDRIRPHKTNELGGTYGSSFAFQSPHTAYYQNSNYYQVAQVQAAQSAASAANTPKSHRIKKTTGAEHQTGTYRPGVQKVNGEYVTNVTTGIPMNHQFAQYQSSVYFWDAQGGPENMDMNTVKRRYSEIIESAQKTIRKAKDFVANLLDKWF